MLDIVTPYQNEPAPAVNAGVIDDCEPRLPSARAGSKPAATEPTNRPGDGADQGEYDQKSDEETHGERHFRPNKVSNIRATPRLDALPAAGQRLRLTNG